MSVRCKAINKDNSTCRNQTKRQYPYCWIHLKSKENLQVKPSNIRPAGLGLFYTGKTPIAAEKKITDYSAREITRTGEGNYSLQISKNQFLDSADPLNFVGRYINDARGSRYNNNVRFGNGYNPRRKDDRFVIPVFTTKRIMPNTELLASYGRNYW